LESIGRRPSQLPAAPTVERREEKQDAVFRVISMTMVLRGVGILILCLAAIAVRMQWDQTFDPRSGRG